MQSGSYPPRSIPLTLFSPMGAHSDAQGRGHIATRALLPLDVSISTHLPKWFIEMAFAPDGESPIYLFEPSATVLTACLAAYRSDGNRRTCVLRIDNKAALDALIKGSSSTIGTVLVDLFWSAAARFPAVWWSEYVNTKSNADHPSRVCDTPLGVECTRCSCEIPPEFSRISPPWSVLHRESALTRKWKIRLCAVLGGRYGLGVPPIHPGCSGFLMMIPKHHEGNVKFRLNGLFLWLG